MCATPSRVPLYAAGTKFAALAVALVALLAAGCDSIVPSTCDNSVAGNPAETYTAGTPSGGTYLSSPWDGPLLWFPGGKIYDFEHHLAVAPRWVSVWVSFAEDGAASGVGVARASGNEAVIEAATSTMITVANPGCQDFWLLVGAGTGATQPSPP